MLISQTIYGLVCAALYVCPMAGIEVTNMLFGTTKPTTTKNSSLMQDHGFQGAPDVVIEVTSKGTVFYDYNKKFLNYEKAGVQEYFIVDPEDKALYRFDLNEGNFKEQFLGYGKITSLIFHFDITF